MDKKITFALLALLGFSTACSTVKNTSKSKEQEPSTTEQPSTIVMYGVRTPDATDQNVPTQVIALPDTPEQSADTQSTAANTEDTTSENQ